MNTPQRRVISDLIDLVWENDKPRIYVDGKPFLYCAFLVASIDTSKASEIRSVDEIAEIPGSHSLEGLGAENQGITPDEQMWGFASSLQGWVESGYNTRAIHSNLAFPLLKELAKAGDAKAKRELQWGLVERLKEGVETTALVILETASEYLDAEAWLAMRKTLEASIRKYEANPNKSPNDDLVYLTSIYYEKGQADLPEPILTILATKGRFPAMIIKGFVQRHEKPTGRIRPLTPREKQWFKAMLAEFSKRPRSYLDIVYASSVSIHFEEESDILALIIEDALARNAHHEYDKIISYGAAFVKRPLLEQVLKNALFKQLPTNALESAQAEILAQIAANPAVTLSMLQQIEDSRRLITGGGASGKIYTALLKWNKYPGLDITPRVLNEESHHDHVIRRENITDYPVVLTRSKIMQSWERTDSTFFASDADLAALGVKQLKGDDYEGKVAFVAMEGAAKGFDSWGQRNGFTRCKFTEQQGISAVTDAWYKKGFVYYLASGSPRSRYMIDRKLKRFVKEAVR